MTCSQLSTQNLPDTMRLQRQNSGLQQQRQQQKGNQELNEELEMKANELEKLFAAHQLRVAAGNQFMSSRRITPVDIQEVPLPVPPPPERVLEKQPIQERVVVELNPNKNIVELGRLNNSKGMLYDRYMKKREAKLREEWEFRRFQNEEKMKDISDSLEHLGAVMKASSAGSRVPAEKLRSFEKKTEQVQGDYASDSSERSMSRQDTSINDSGDDSTTRSSKPKKLVHSRTFSSSNPRSSVPPLPRSASKGANVGRRRILPENSVAQSLPNFSDENRKQSQGTRKEATRLQFSHIPRSKSTNGQTPPSSKKDNVLRSQSMKTNSPSSESKDLSSPNYNGINSGRFRKNGEPKPFLKKGNGIGAGAGAGIAKLKATLESENMDSEEESSQTGNKQGDSVSMVEETRIASIPTDSDSESSRARQQSERSDIPHTEEIVILKSKPRVEPEMVSEPTMVPSPFHTPVRPSRDSPMESPASWSSNMHSPFSYSHKRPDIDVSVGSPAASTASWNSQSAINFSPASWNSQPATNLETDSPRTRKKWGVAQKPFIPANASDHQPHNLTKGIKRLLSFGKKSRGTEGTADCISATTSDGDDEIEDGRNLAGQSSEDLRKSRMGFSQGHCSYEAFNKEGEFASKEAQNFHSSIPKTPENYKLKDHHLSGSLLAAPRSFFSLSSFRSKGSDLKPR